MPPFPHFPPKIYHNSGIVHCRSSEAWADIFDQLPGKMVKFCEVKSVAYSMQMLATDKLMDKSMLGVGLLTPVVKPIKFSFDFYLHSTHWTSGAKSHFLLSGCSHLVIRVKGGY